MWGRTEVLNLPTHHSTAAIAVKIGTHDDLSNAEIKHVSTEGSITISDCNRTITLNLELYLNKDTVRGRAEALEEIKNIEYKINKLISVLNDLKINFKDLKQDLIVWVHS